MSNYLADIMTQLFGHSILEDAPVDSSAGSDYGSTGGYSPTELVRLGLLHPGTLSKQGHFLGGVRPGAHPTNTARLPADSVGTPSQNDTGPSPNAGPAQDDILKIVDIIKELYPPTPAPAAPASPTAPVSGGSSGGSAPSAKPPAQKPPRPAAPANPYLSGHGGTTGGTTTTTATPYNPYAGSRH